MDQIANTHADFLTTGKTASQNVYAMRRRHVILSMGVSRKVMPM